MKPTVKDVVDRVLEQGGTHTIVLTLNNYRTFCRRLGYVTWRKRKWMPLPQSVRYRGATITERTTKRTIEGESDE